MVRAMPPSRRSGWQLKSVALPPAQVRARPRRLPPPGDDRWRPSAWATPGARTVRPAARPHTVVYAFGVGTDISFERDLIARYGVTVHAFDPTPIALEWAAAQRLPDAVRAPPLRRGRLRRPRPLRRAAESGSSRPSAWCGSEGGRCAWRLPCTGSTTLVGMLRLPPPDLIKLDIEGAEYARARRPAGEWIPPRGRSWSSFTTAGARWEPGGLARR